ncbi:MAG: hypothetical protein KGP29_07335 [Proteobacteria bacterium]|nr:hypothetical protein [Pseudomonadota bacterium]
MIRLHYFLILLILFSCSNRAARFLPDRPSKEFKKSIAEGSPEFAQGWKDGCEVGMSTASNTFYKMFYRNNAIDGFKMGSSSDYSTAWNNAFLYCIRSDSIKQGSSIWGSMFGGYK